MALAVLGVVAAGCSAGASTQPLPDGVYSGSTKADREVDLQVNGGEVKLDGKVLKHASQTQQRYVERKRHWEISCEVEKPSKDLSCVLTRGGITETVELMRL